MADQLLDVVYGFNDLSIKKKYEAAIGCLQHISKLSIGNRQVPYGERIAAKWLKERHIN